MDRLTKAQMEFMNGYVPATIHDIYEYATGGGIHIKDSKKGTFTAAATKHGKSVQAFASQVLANKDNYSPAMVKKANFAKNAAKWKHQDGGATSEQNELIQQIAKALQKGAKPEQILQELIKMGISQEEGTQAIQAIMKQMQDTQMQEGGSTPQELTGQEQPQGGQQDVQQLMQGIQQALQEGAQPEEVIAQLLQEQIDPQKIIEIFVQLGMPQEQVVQVVESVMQQMGSGQEQEVPQEQMQEQGMEEPMQEAPQETMEYGGVPQYPYGGLYANDYAANFMPDSKFNRFLTNTNMLSDPSLNYKTQGMAAAGFKPAIAFEGIKGIASMFAGSAAGYKGAFNKLFGNKNKPDEITTPQAQAYYSKYFKDKGDSFAKKMENKYFDTPKINPFGQNTSIPSIATPPFNPNKKSFSSFKFEDGGPIDNPGFNALPDYVQEKIIANMQYGGLPEAQFGIDWSDPFGLKKKRFGQTADNADTKGYTDEKYIPQYNYSTPGFVEGMGVGQEGYGGADNSMYDNKFPKPQLAYDVQKNKDITEDTTDYGTHKLKKRILNQGKTNTKTLNDSNTKNTLNPIGVSGNTMFTNSMTGLGAVSNFIDMFDTDPETLQKRAQRKANEDYMNSLTYNPKNPYGERTPNAGILKPNMRTVQDIGSSQYAGKYGGVTKYANGGQMQYQQGGEYHVTHDELLQLMRNGAEVEFL